MLPFRSGRAGFSGASSAFLFVAVLSCVALAGEKTPRQPESRSEEQTKGRGPRREEGLTNIPIATGHDAKGLVLPEFDLKGHLRGKTRGGNNKAAR